MKKLYFKANTEQRNELQGLAYRIADNSYMIERYGKKEARHELEENRKTLSIIFDRLDLLCVPYWVQNSIICGSENWRNYKSGLFAKNLEAKNIYL